MLTEGINVGVKTGFNRFHAVLAFLFWLGVGIFAHVKFDSMLFVLAGIVIGIVRLFIINDKYAWQVATLEEIQYVKSLLLEEKEYKKIIELGKTMDEIKSMLRALEEHISYFPRKEGVIMNDKNQNSEEASYMQINRNGRSFVMKGGKLYCPKCHSFVDSDTQTMCSNCGHSFV
jgi:hypothetical protein